MTSWRDEAIEAAMVNAEDQEALEAAEEATFFLLTAVKEITQATHIGTQELCRVTVEDVTFVAQPGLKDRLYIEGRCRNCGAINVSGSIMVDQTRPEILRDIGTFLANPDHPSCELQHCEVDGCAQPVIGPGETRCEDHNG